MTSRASSSAVADQLVDAALKLPLFYFALAQPLCKIGDRRVGRAVRPGCGADKIIAPPDNPGEKEATLLRDGPHEVVFWQLANLTGNVAADPIHRRAALADFLDHLVSSAFAAFNHRTDLASNEDDSMLARMRWKLAAREK